jgi:signal transduction histidine kinase
MITQKEKNVINKLFEAVDILRKHIDKSEAIKRVFVLYIILCGFRKFRRTGTPNRLSRKGKRDRIKFESTQIPQFLSFIDDWFRKTSPSTANALKIRKYASGLPAETSSELFRIMLSTPRYSAKERIGVISAFCLSPNILALLGNRKPKATPDCLIKLAIKMLDLDYYDSSADVFHSIDESLYPGLGYEHKVDLLLDALHCNEKERGVIFDLAMIVAGVDNNWKTYYTEFEPPEDYKPSGVFCNPIDSEDFDAGDRSDSFYQNFFSKIINDHLDSFSGRMGIIIPLNSLSEDGKVKNVLKSLLNKDQIKCVIELPEKLFLPRTEIATAFVVLQKEKNENRKNRVAFVRSGYRQKDNYVNISNREITKLKKLLHRFKSDWKQIAIIQYNEINRCGNNFLPSYHIDWLRRELESLKTSNFGAPLESLTRVVQGGSDTISLDQIRRGTYVAAKDLHPEKAKIFIDNLMNKTNPDPKQTKINEKCILISLRHESLKPTIYEPDNFSTTPLEALLGSSEVLINKGVIAIFPNEDVIDIEYLYFQLYSDLVVRQIQSKLYESDKKMTNLKLEDLKSLIIRVPGALEEQLKKVKHEKIILLDEESLKQQIDIMALKKRLNITEIKRKAQLETVGELAHEFRPWLALLKGRVDSVYELIKSKNLLDEFICKNKDGTEQTARDDLDLALKAHQLITNILDETQRLTEMKIDRGEFSRVNICDVFRHDIEPLCSGEKYVIRVSCDVQDEVFMHRLLFIRAMNNIINNAKMHGFQENQTNAEIKFEITERSGNIVIDCTNNGRNFPDNMTREDFLTLGKKAVTSPGRGYGGALISKVISAHDGIFEIVRDENPVHFRITLPKEG